MIARDNAKPKRNMQAGHSASSEEPFGPRNPADDAFDNPFESVPGPEIDGFGVDDEVRVSAFHDPRPIEIIEIS